MSGIRGTMPFSLAGTPVNVKQGYVAGDKIIRMARVIAVVEKI